MNKTIFTMALLSSALLISCNSRNNKNISQEQEIAPANSTNVEVTPAVEDNIVNNSVTDKQGTTLHMSYNNTQGTATMRLNDETITLKQDTTASGVRVHNNEYEYEEWQGHIVLKKNGQVVFDNQANTSTTSKPQMTYNNNNGTATMKLNGQTFTLQADTTASGLRFRNNEYEYEEWKGNVVLKKNGQVVFDSRK